MIIVVAAIAVCGVIFMLRGHHGDGGVETDIHGYTIATDETGEFYYYATDADGNHILIEPVDDVDMLVYTNDSGETVTALPVETDASGKVVVPKVDTDKPVTKKTGASSSGEQTWNSDWEDYFAETAGTAGTAGTSAAAETTAPVSEAVTVTTGATSGTTSAQTGADTGPDTGAESSSGGDTTENEWGDEYFPGWY